MFYKEYFCMNTLDEMWQRVFENFDAAKVSAEDAGKVAKQTDKFVQTEGLSTLSEDIRVQQNKVKHQLPLLRFGEKIKIDVVNIGG